MNLNLLQNKKNCQAVIFQVRPLYLRLKVYLPLEEYIG